MHWGRCSINISRAALVAAQLQWRTTSSDSIRCRKVPTARWYRSTLSRVRRRSRWNSINFAAIRCSANLASNRSLRPRGSTGRSRRNVRLSGPQLQSRSCRRLRYRPASLRRVSAQRRRPSLCCPSGTWATIPSRSILPMVWWRRSSRLCRGFGIYSSSRETRALPTRADP